MARLKVVAGCVVVPAGLAAVALIAVLTGGFGALDGEIARQQTILLLRASCKSADLRPSLPTSLGLAALRHLRS